MKKNLKYVYYRQPRTRNEMRANQEGWERPRRRPHLLPDTYDDLWPTHEKSWKAKRKTQYHPGGRGKEHSIEVDVNFTYEWDLEKYFKEHNIPYRIEDITEPYTFKRKLWKRVLDSYKSPVYQHVRKWNSEERKWGWVIKVIRWEYKSHWEEDGWEWVNSYRTIAYKITWWYNKDIGIDYILNQCCRRRLYSYI